MKLGSPPVDDLHPSPGALHTVLGRENRFFPTLGKWKGGKHSESNDVDDRLLVVLDPAEDRRERMPYPICHLNRDTAFLSGFSDDPENKKPYIRRTPRFSLLSTYEPRHQSSFCHMVILL